ncbi:MAG TPA: TfoX/Sxy family protein [Candidatus Saccharimonadia bacterium]|nr:TfoX/Sxy family protein [Candidatus Saccharimonadia bacterium]
MATDARTIDFITEQVASAGDIRSRKMFGEYALYCDDKVVAFVCDDQLFIKPTDAGRTYIGTPDEAPAYPGSKLYFRIPEDRWEDHEWMTELVRVTAGAVPLPKPKKR